MINIVLTVVDADGDKFPVSVYGSVNNGTTIVQMRDQAEALWDVIRPLVTGVVVGASINIVADDQVQNWTNNIVDVLSDIEEKAKFTWSVPFAGGSEFRMTLPTVREAIFTGAGSGKTVDITDSDVAAFLAFMQPNTLPAFHACDSHEYDIGEPKRQYQWFGKG